MCEQPCNDFEHALCANNGLCICVEPFVAKYDLAIPNLLVGCEAADANVQNDVGGSTKVRTATGGCSTFMIIYLWKNKR